MITQAQIISEQMNDDLGGRGGRFGFDPWGAELPPGHDPTGQSQDADNAFLDWYRTGALSEAIIESFPPVRSAVDRLLTYVIGDGFNISPNTGDQNLDDDLEQYYLSICTDEKRIDYDEESNLKGVLRKLLRGALVPGGHFAAFVGGKHTRDGFGKVQLIEAYRCKTPYNKVEGENIVHGVRLAANSRRQVGYWFEPDDIGWEQFVRPAVDGPKYLPAEDAQGNRLVVHFRIPDRSSGTKSKGVMASGLDTVYQHQRLRDNVNTKAEVMNAVAMFKEIDVNADDAVKKMANERLLRSREMDRGLSFRPGQTVWVPAGMKARIESANIPNQEFFTLDDLLLMEVSSLYWIPLALLRLDASEANFSSIKMMMRASQPGFRYFQDMLIDQFLKHWWVFVLADLQSRDRVVNNAVQRMKYDPKEAKWLWPGWHGLDPEKDAECDNYRLSNGLVSDTRVFQERGLNFIQEAPLIVGDAKWRMELVLEHVLDPAFRALYEQAGLTPNDAFTYLYGRTSPNGQKLAEAVAKHRTANNAEMEEMQSGERNDT